VGFKDSCTSHYEYFQQHHSAGISYRLDNEPSNTTFQQWDVNNPSNYRTIMIIPLFAKLFGSMLENRISMWAEEGDKRAKGQAGFRPKHSMIDHGITLRHIIEKVW
jgi:hypothetical protein